MVSATLETEARLEEEAQPQTPTQLRSKAAPAAMLGGQPTLDAAALSEGDSESDIQSNYPMRSRSSHSLARPRAASLTRVVLTGYMGAGKTTIGRLLAGRLGWEFVDLDSLIEERTGKTIADIILHDSEPAFRRVESQALAVALGKRKIVLALGGGAAESLTNRLLLEQTPATLNVFLDAPFDVLLQRCEAQLAGAVRPLLADPVEAESRFQQRLPLYRRIAKATIETSHLDASATVETLLAEVRRAHPEVEGLIQAAHSAD